MPSRSVNPTPTPASSKGLDHLDANAISKDVFGMVAALAATGANPSEIASECLSVGVDESMAVKAILGLEGHDPGQRLSAAMVVSGITGTMDAIRMAWGLLEPDPGERAVRHSRAIDGPLAEVVALGTASVNDFLSSCAEVGIPSLDVAIHLYLEATRSGGMNDGNKRLRALDRINGTQWGECLELSHSIDPQVGLGCALNVLNIRNFKGEELPANIGRACQSLADRNGTLVSIDSCPNLIRIGSGIAAAGGFIVRDCPKLEKIGPSDGIGWLSEARDCPRLTRMPSAKPS
jgi:hypothetical protein